MAKKEQKKKERWYVKVEKVL